MAQSVGRGLGRAAGLPRPGPLPAGVGWAWGGERARPCRLSGVPVHGDVVVTGSPGTLAVAAGHRLAVPVAVWSCRVLEQLLKQRGCTALPSVPSCVCAYRTTSSGCWTHVQPGQNLRFFTAVVLQVPEVTYTLRRQRRRLLWSDTRFCWHCRSRKLQFAVCSKNSFHSITE